MILPFRGRTPRIAPSAFIAPTATIIGDVTVGDEASVWFGAVLRGDVGRIEIGARSSVQDNAVLHTTDRIATVIGDDVTIGHGAVLEGCTVERGALVGMNAVVLHEAVVGEEALIGAGSVVTDGTKIPARTLAAGSPCRVRKPLEGIAAQWITRAGPAYVRLSRRYLEEDATSTVGAPPAGGRASEGPVPG